MSQFTTIGSKLKKNGKITNSLAIIHFATIGKINKIYYW